jgi:hypothetical protein
VQRVRPDENIANLCSSGIQHREKTRQSGFTLLLAALVASIALTLGSALFGFATKQLALSSINKNSQFAFFNADSATECALYWDVKGSETVTFFSTSTPPNEIVCEGQTVPIDYADTSSGPSWQSSTFSFQYAPNNTPPSQQGSCANVVVTKTVGFGSAADTSIQARGLSTSCSTILSNKTVLERAAQLSY